MAQYQGGARYRFQKGRFMIGLGGGIAWFSAQCYPVDFMVEKDWWKQRRPLQLKFFHFTWKSDLAHLVAAVGPVTFAIWRA